MTAAQPRASRSARPARPRGPSEDAIQKGAIAGIRAACPRAVALHIPNGGRRGKVEAARLKGLGVLAGAPDLVVALPAGRTLWVELKTERGVLSESQRAMRDQLAALGHTWALARDAAEAVLIARGAYLDAIRAEGRA